jgi:hypothetical protein
MNQNKQKFTERVIDFIWNWWIVNFVFVFV